MVWATTSGQRRFGVQSNCLGNSIRPGFDLGVEGKGRLSSLDNPFRGGGGGLFVFP